MSKKDYEMLAEAIRNIRKEKEVRNIPGDKNLTIRKVCAGALANAFLKNCPTFDTIKWFNACEV